MLDPGRASSTAATTSAKASAAAGSGKTGDAPARVVKQLVEQYGTAAVKNMTDVFAERKKLAE
jgi:hypothetical protein